MIFLRVQDPPRSGDKPITAGHDWPNTPIRRSDPTPNPNGPRGPQFVGVL